jgi:hypothetical protein
VLAAGLLALAAAAIAGSVVDFALPAMRLFAVVFVVLIGAVATLIAARTRGWRQAFSAPILAALGATGVMASVASTAYFLVKNPSAAEHFPPIAAATLAVLLAGCTWLALTPPRGLTPNPLAGGFAAGAALAFGIGFVWAARLSIHTLGGPMIWQLFAPIVLFFVAAAAAAAIGRSFRAGVQTAVWATLLGTMLVFALSLPETMHRFAIDGRTLGDGESGKPIGVNLSSSIWGLVQAPMFGLPFGVFGAAVGRWLRRGSQSAPFISEDAR